MIWTTWAAPRRTRRIAELAENAVRRHLRTIVFCPSVESALECNRLLQEKGMATNVVTANTPGEDRRAIIDTFKSDSREAHDNIQLWRAHCRFRCAPYPLRHYCSPYHLTVLYSQMAGRAMPGPRLVAIQEPRYSPLLTRIFRGSGSVTEAFTNWERLWTTSSPT